MLKQIVPVSALAFSLGLLGVGCAAQVEDTADQSAEQALVGDEAKSVDMTAEERTGETQQAWWGGWGGFGFPFWGGWGGFGFPFWGGWGGFGGCGFGFPGFWGGWGGWGGFGGCW